MTRLYEVRIYDRNGKLKRVVQPKIDYDNLTNYGNPKGRKTFNKIPAEKKEKHNELQSHDDNAGKSG